MVNGVFNLVCTDRYFKFVLPAVCLVAAVVASLLLMHTPMNGDVGYYLLCAREMAHGSVPYVDFKLLYPPVAVAVFSLPFLLFGDVPDISAFLFVQYLFVAASALLSYLLIRARTHCKTYAAIFALVVFLYIFQLEGQFIILEPVTLFFALLSIWFLSIEKPYSFFVSGVFLCLASLSKQYGLGFAVPCVVYLMMVPKNIPRKLVLFSGGFLVVFLAFTSVCVYGLGLSYLDFFNVFWNSSYGTRTMSAFGSKLAVFFKADALFLVSSVLLVSALYFHQRKRHVPGALNRLEVTLLCAGIFMISTYFFPPTAFRHYAIFIIPPLILSLALYLFRMAAADVFGKNIVLIFVLVSLLSVNPIVRWVAHGLNPSGRLQQIAVGKSLSAVLPPGSKVTLLCGELEIYRFLCLWPAPLPKTVGYDWYYMITPQLKRDLLDHSNFALAYKQDSALIRDLDGLPFAPMQNVGDICIYHRVENAQP